MFTGLIEKLGRVLSVEEGAGSWRIAIATPPLALRTGDSIAVNGVCLTALEIEPQPGGLRFQADLSGETVNRTSLARLAPGSTVNLELPTPAGAPLGGHVVQGHVDGTGRLLSLEAADTEASPQHADWWLKIIVPHHLTPYMVEKGSVAIEGISLTIARWEPGATEGDIVHAAIIPHTYAQTNLHTLKAGDPVNVEADVLMKQAERRSREAEFQLTVEYLISNGY